jgi:hypothetical protein
MGISRGEARTTDQWSQHNHISSKINGIKSEKFELSPDLLCKNWCIGRMIAERKLQATTQLRMKTVANSSIERRWLTGDLPERFVDAGRQFNT